MKLFTLIFIFYCFSNCDGFCFKSPKTVCGQQVDTSAGAKPLCKKFPNICKLDWNNRFSGTQYKEVPISNCQSGAIFAAATCVTEESCDPNAVCSREPQNIVCGMQTNVFPYERFCRTFQNQCELDKFNCAQQFLDNPTIFKPVQETMCNTVGDELGICS